MKRHLAIAVCALAALTVTAVAGAAKPAPKPKPGTNSLTIRATPNPVVWGNTTTISGALSGPNAGGQAVELRQNPYPYTGGFKALKSTTTASNGRYTFAVAPGLNTQYRVTARGVTSPTALVLVAKRVTLHVSDSTPARGQRIRFYGTVSPAFNGHYALIQKRTSTGYHTIARALLVANTTTSSRYSKRVRITTSTNYRVRVPADPAHASGSRTRFLAVH